MHHFEQYDVSLVFITVFIVQCIVFIYASVPYVWILTGPHVYVRWKIGPNLELTFFIPPDDKLVWHLMNSAATNLFRKKYCTLYLPYPWTPCVYNDLTVTTTANQPYWNFWQASCSIGGAARWMPLRHVLYTDVETLPNKHMIQG